MAGQSNMARLGQARVVFAFLLLFLGCADFERDNPEDENGINYNPNWADKYSSSFRSSSSSFRSSSSVALGSSSSSAPPSSSSLAVVSNCSADFSTVRIGTQVWASENLNCNVDGSKCYNNDPANCDKYGRLYNWATAMNLPSSCNSNTCSSQIGSPHRGICPSGWHIPNDDDWNVLMDYVGGSSTAGTKLKAKSGWNSYSGVPVGTDAYGFSALPGGLGVSDGSFDGAGDDGDWWSASEDNSDIAYSRDMYYYYEHAYWDFGSKSCLFSVRCLQD